MHDGENLDSNNEESKVKLKKKGFLVKFFILLAKFFLFTSFFDYNFKILKILK